MHIRQLNDQYYFMSYHQDITYVGYICYYAVTHVIYIIYEIFTFMTNDLVTKMKQV